MTNPTLPEAIAQVDGLDHDMWNELGEKMTCTETDALVALFRAVGLDSHADSLYDCHVVGDVDGDDLEQHCADRDIVIRDGAR